MATTTTSPDPGTAPSPAQSAGMWVTRVIGFFVALCVVATMTSLVVAGFFTQRATEVVEPTGTVSAVVVTVTSGDVTLVPAASGRLRVERTVRWSFDRPSGGVALRDGTATVTGDCSGGPLFGTCAVDVLVQVPTGVSVSTRTTSGDVTVRDLTGRLDLQTTSGDLQGSGLRSRNARLQSTAGDLNVAFAEPPDDVALEATAGDVVLRLPVAGVSYRVDDRSSVGDRRVEVPTDAASPHKVSVRTSLGDITVTPL